MNSKSNDNRSRPSPVDLAYFDELVCGPSVLSYNKLLMLKQDSESVSADEDSIEAYEEALKSMAQCKGGSIEILIGSFGVRHELITAEVSLRDFIKSIEHNLSCLSRHFGFAYAPGAKGHPFATLRRQATCYGARVSTLKMMFDKRPGTEESCGWPLTQLSKVAKAEDGDGESGNKDV